MIKNIIAKKVRLLPLLQLLPLLHLLALHATLYSAAAVAEATSDMARSIKISNNNANSTASSCLLDPETGAMPSDGSCSGPMQRAILQLNSVSVLNSGCSASQIRYNQDNNPSNPQAGFMSRSGHPPFLFFRSFIHSFYIFCSAEAACLDLLASRTRICFARSTSTARTRELARPCARSLCGGLPVPTRWDSTRRAAGADQDCDASSMSA